MIGQTISHYRITEKLGEGGMGVVYKAEDTKLERTVALKFLGAHLLNDEEAKARFLREARAAAGLHHPNICPVYEIDEAEGKTFLSMAFIKGEPLEARIDKGPLPLKDVLDIGRQVAEGLEAAHEEGVVHRDIKPANVMVDAKGRATIMDFGLARLTEASRLTKADQTMGTVAYMSPEQAQGMEVDNRSDIWALGVVLYEMVRGQRPFQGEYDQALLFEIVHQEPEPLTGIRAGVPMELEFIVGKCLAKDREDRPASAQEIARDLRTLGDKLKSGRSTIMQAVPAVATGTHLATGTPVVTSPSVDPERKPKLPWAIAALAVVAAAVFAFLHFTQPPSDQPVYEFTVPLPDQAQIHTLGLSPDARHLAFTVESEETVFPLMIRAADSAEVRELAGTKGATFPFWSPDGTYIGFFAQGKLKKIALAGGPAVSLCDAPRGRGGSWNEEGVIVFAPKPFGGFQRVSAAGGEPVALLTGDEVEGVSRRFPSFLPDGRHFLYLERSPRGDDESGIFLGSIDGQPPRRLLGDESNAAYVPGVSAAGGAIFFHRDDTLMAQPFDAIGLEFAGAIYPVLEGVGPARHIGNYAFSASNEGTLAYGRRRERGEQEAQLAWFDREGAEIERIGEPQRISHVDLSPDGETVALSVRDDTQVDIWLYELSRGTASRFTSDPGHDGAPVWSPDGAFIAFASDRLGGYTLFRKSAAGVSEAEPLAPPEGRGLIAWAPDWSPDGRFLLYTTQDSNTRTNLRLLPLDGDRTPLPFLVTEFLEGSGRFSPDGRWVAYHTNQSGRLEVHIRSFPKADREWKISTEGGRLSRWRADGKELFYIAPDGTLTAVAIDAGDAIKAGIPQALFATKIGFAGAGRSRLANYDVSPDGQRFLIANATNDPDDADAATEALTVITNWPAKIRD